MLLNYTTNAIGSAASNADKQEAINHLNVILSSVADDAGFIEIRTFQERDASGGDKFARSYFLPTNADQSKIEAAVNWCERESKGGRGVFVGLNPRKNESGKKDAVKAHSAAFLDLDLDKRGIDRETALGEIEDLSPIKPTYVLESGGGLHVAYYFNPTNEYSEWLALQEKLFSQFQSIGADNAVTSDSSRVLRLAGFPNWKYDEPRQTKLLEFTPAENKPSFAAIAELFDVDFNAKAERKHHKLPERIVEGGDGVRYEGRNTLLFKEASSLRQRGYEREEIGAAISQINQSRCVPPLPENEVDSIVESVSKYEIGEKLSRHAEAENEISDLDKLFPTWEKMNAAVYGLIAYLLFGLSRGSLGMISGVTNFGKSLLVRNLAVSLASGREYLNILKSGKPKRVLLLDYETPAAVFQNDIKKMTIDFSDEEKEAVGKNLRTYTNLQMDMPMLNLSESKYFQVVEDMVSSFEPDVIIIDTVSAAFTIKQENDNGEVTALMKKLQRLAKNANAVVLFTHHIGKSGSEEGSASNSHYRSRGASSFQGMSVAVIQLDEKNSKGEKVRTMKYAKVKDKTPDEVILIQNDETRWFEIDGSGRMAFSKSEEKYQKILEIIKTPTSKKEIIEKSGVAEKTVEGYLDRAIRERNLERLERGVYAPFGWIPFGENETNH